jgi:hypothetical protein
VFKLYVKYEGFIGHTLPPRLLELGLEKTLLMSLGTLTRTFQSLNPVDWMSTSPVWSHHMNIRFH